MHALVHRAPLTGIVSLLAGCVAAGEELGGQGLADSFSHEIIEVEGVLQSELSYPAALETAGETEPVHDKVDGQLWNLRAGLSASGLDVQGWVDPGPIVERVWIEGDRVRMPYSATVHLAFERQDLDQLAGKLLVAPGVTWDLAITHATLVGPEIEGPTVCAAMPYLHAPPPWDDCPLPHANARLRITSVGDNGSTYPEYDRLVSDGVVSAAVLLASPVKDTNEMNRALDAAGFVRRDQPGPATSSSFWSRERGGLLETVSVQLFVEQEIGAAFRFATRGSEIVALSGHEYLIDDPAADPASYAAGTYQVVLLNGCYTYLYDAAPTLRAKSHATGDHSLVDVVTTLGSSDDTTWTTMALLEDLFAGSEAALAGRAGPYGWSRILGDVTAASAKHGHGTSWVVSGATQNRYRP